jgi:hypothetical protein
MIRPLLAALPAGLVPASIAAPAALAVLIGLVGSAAPAVASTMPPLEVGRGRAVLAGGAWDANLDVGLSDRLAVGASLTQLGAWYGAVRATYRMGDADGQPTWGWTCGAGFGQLWLYSRSLNGLWLQPAIEASTPIAPGWPIYLRLSLGPVLFLLPDEESTGRQTASGVPIVQPILANWLVLAWPNLELAWRVNAHNELTLLGNSLIGWRAIL